MKNEIIQLLEIVGGKEITPIEESNTTVISFKKNVSENDLDFLLICMKEKDMLVINLVHAYPAQYEQMEADFYEVINKLNENCIHGYLGFIKEEKTQIAYKSTYIGDVTNLTGNNSFEYFLRVSFDMADYFHLQLS
jgi:hypothetical protein